MSCCCRMGNIKPLNYWIPSAEQRSCCCGMGNIKFNIRPNNKWQGNLNVGSEQRSCCCGMGNIRPNNKAISVGSDSCTSPVDTSMWHAKCWYFQCDIQNVDMAFKTARQCACASLVATRSSRPKATEVHCHEKQRHRRLDQNPIWRQLRGSCLAINMSFPNQCDIENLNVNTAFTDIFQLRRARTHHSNPPAGSLSSKGGPHLPSKGGPPFE